MNTSIKIIPFWWNIDKENELVSLVENMEDYLTDYFFKELIFSSAKILVFAGETFGYFHEQIIEKHGKDTPVIAIGDFNDVPFYVSLAQNALSLRSKTKVCNNIWGT
jgi:hypothetical protein